MSAALVFGTVSKILGDRTVMCFFLSSDFTLVLGTVIAILDDRTLMYFFSSDFTTSFCLPL